MSNDLLAELWLPSADVCNDAQAYALIDHGGAPGLTAQLKRHDSLRWRSLFEGSKETGALEVAPILVELGPLSTPPCWTADLLMRWLADSCSHANAVLCLHSTLALNALAPALKARIEATLPGKMPVMLRYFDTRVFEPLLWALTPEQASIFLGVASRWVWLDRSGQIQRRSSVQQPTDSWSTPFALTDAQEAALIEAAEPDAVLLHMRQGAPDLCGTQEPAQLHALVSRTLPAAKRYGITDARQQALFCLTEIESGPAFHEQALWRQALESAAASGTTFARLLGQMAAA